MKEMTLIPLKDGAAILGMVYETFRRKRAAGKLPYLQIYRPGGGRAKVSKDSVLEQLRRSVVED